MSAKGKTTISLEPDVAKALKYYLADTEQSFRYQSKVINEILRDGLAKKKIGEQGNELPCAA